MRPMIWLTVITTLISLSATAADDVSKPVRVSPDGHFLMQTDGKPFFYLGENAEYLFWRITRKTRICISRAVLRKDSRSFWANLVPRWNLNEPNAYGEKAFIQNDVGRPNPKYFEHGRLGHRARQALWIARRPRPDQRPPNTWPKANSTIRTRKRTALLGERYRRHGRRLVLGWDSMPIWPAANPANPATAIQPMLS